jgi:hypothetical protein
MILMLRSACESDQQIRRFLDIVDLCAQKRQEFTFLWKEKLKDTADIETHLGVVLVYGVKLKKAVF